MLKSIITTVIIFVIVIPLGQKNFFAQQKNIVFEHYSIDRGCMKQILLL